VQRLCFKSFMVKIDIQWSNQYWQCGKNRKKKYWKAQNKILLVIRVLKIN